MPGPDKALGSFLITMMKIKKRQRELISWQPCSLGLRESLSGNLAPEGVTSIKLCYCHLSYLCLWATRALNHPPDNMRPEAGGHRSHLFKSQVGRVVPRDVSWLPGCSNLQHFLLFSTLSSQPPSVSRSAGHSFTGWLGSSQSDRLIIYHSS